MDFLTNIKYITHVIYMNYDTAGQKSTVNISIMTTNKQPVSALNLSDPPIVLYT